MLVTSYLIAGSSAATCTSPHAICHNTKVMNIQTPYLVTKNNNLVTVFTQLLRRGVPSTNWMQTV